MSDTTTGYVPYDYRRVCDLCGNLYNRSKLQRNGPYLYCPDHAEERIAQTLDRGNARQRPFRILPVPNGKPADERAPDTFEAETSTIFNLIDFVRGADARYAQVESGEAAPLPNAADVIPINSWACWFYYGLATATYRRGHKDVWHDQALARLRTCADVILARQTTSGTRATNAFYGGLLGSGATVYYSEDASVGGLALLYAYRCLGDAKYLYAARACASFLRNCQAVGSDATHFTSTDAAGTSRLSTGGIVNSVSTADGFYSDGLFYPSGLLAYQFWNELKLTDGDQSLGATAAIASNFDTAPAKQLSDCMTLLRSFWETGTYDVTQGDVRTGLSATTPAEYFNAYPANKANANNIGTGSWEYQDGGAAQGTIVSSLNFAKALAALYAVEGLSAQVQAIDDWLQTFTSNAAFETPAVSSPHTLQRSTTGTYDCALCPAQWLLVRDASNGYAPIAKNGGSLYDWGAFGVLAPLLSTRHAYGFKIGRYQASLPRRRLSDGLPSDGDWDDTGYERGRQGLTFQTDFKESLAHGPTAGPIPATQIAAPPTDNMVFWFKADAGVTMNASSQVSNWADQGPNGWDVQPVNASGFIQPTSTWPVYRPSAINGLPALEFQSANSSALNHLFTLGSTNLPTADGAPVTVLALAKPHGTNGHFGGVICTLRLTDDDLECGMRWDNLFLIGPANVPIATAQSARSYYVQPPIDYTDVNMVMDWTFYGASATPQASVFVNGSPIGFTGNVSPLTAYTGTVGFSIGYINAVFAGYWNGYITEVICYGGSDPGTLAQARNYLLARAGQLTTGLVYDGLAAAQYGLSLRYGPRA